VAGATTVVLVVAIWQRRSWRDLRLVVAGTGIWVLSFLLEYLISLRKLHSVKALLGYWQGGFAPRPLAIGSTLTWIGSAVHGVIGLPLDFGVWPLAVLLVVLGMATLLWRRTLIGLFVVIVVAVVFFAAIIQQYPIQGRMVLFFVPLGCLAIASPMLLSKRMAVQVVCACLAGVVLLPSIASAAHAAADPYTRTEAREAYLYVQEHERPGDKMLIEWSGTAVYLYYHETIGVTGIGSFKFSGSPKSCNNSVLGDDLSGTDRVWFIFAVPPGIESNAISQYLIALRRLGRILTVHPTPGNAGAVLVQINHHDATTDFQLPAPNWAPAPHGCLQFNRFRRHSGSSERSGLA
jgi:hypothetical protein